MWFLPLRCQAAAPHACAASSDGQTDTTGGPLYDVCGVHNSPVVTEQTTTHTPTTGVVFVFTTATGRETKERTKRIRQHTGNEHPGVAKQLPPTLYNAPHRLFGETTQWVHSPRHETRISNRHTGPVVSPPWWQGALTSLF